MRLRRETTTTSSPAWCLIGRRSFSSLGWPLSFHRLSLPPLLLLLRTPLSAITLFFSFFFLYPSSPFALTCTLRDSSLSLTWNNPIVLTRSDTFSAVLDSYILRLHVWVGGRANSESSTPGTIISLAFVRESLRKVYRRSANPRLWVKRLKEQMILFLEVNRYQTRHSRISQSFCSVKFLKVDRVPSQSPTIGQNRQSLPFNWELSSTYTYSGWSSLHNSRLITSANRRLDLHFV